MKKMLLPALAFIASCVAVSSCGKDAVMLPDAAESSSASVLATTTASVGTLGSILADGFQKNLWLIGKVLRQNK